MKKYLGLLFVILLLGSILRTFKLASRPDGFTWDEAALGYNAYSLLKTGRDEYGKALPIILKSFGDYKPGLYSYLTVPPTVIGGLNPFTTRLPSAIFGILGIVSVFLLAEEMFGKRIGMTSALLMAINPWSIQFSRGAWEANVSLVLTEIGTLLFLRKKYFWCAVFLGLTFWTYQGAKLFTPLIAISLVLIYRSQINFKTVFKQSLIAIIFLLPIVAGWGTQSGRLKVYSVFSYHRSTQDSQEIISQDGGKLGMTYYLFHSQLLDQLRGVYGRYLNHWTSKFLFISGDWTSLRHTIAYYGYFHIFEILTITLGLIWATRNVNSHVKFLLTWAILSPIPAALSRDTVSGIRALALVLPLVILSGIGLSIISYRKYLRIIFSALIVFFVIYYADLYFVHAPYFSAVDWLYPYQPAMKLVGENMQDYKKIVISKEYGQPYIFVLYYLKLDPKTYQSQSSLVEDSEGDVGTVKSFSKFEFRRINWPDDRDLTSTLFVGTPIELPEQDLPTVNNLIQIGDVDFLNGQPALRIVAIP